MTRYFDHLDDLAAIKAELTDAYISTRLNDVLTALCPEGYKARYHKPEKHEHGRWVYIYAPDSGYNYFSCITLGGLDIKRIDAEKIDKFIDDHNKTIARYTAALDAFYDNVAQYNNLVGYFADLQSKIYPVMSQLDTRFSRF